MKNRVVNERRISVLTDLLWAQLMDSKAIQGRHFRSDVTGSQTRRELRKLCAAGLTERIHGAIRYQGSSRGRPTEVYRGTPEAIQILSHITGEEYPRPPLAMPHADTLEHRLFLGELCLLTRDACKFQGLQPPQWIHEYAPRIPAPASNKAKLYERFLLCHSFPGTGAKPVSCWPDAACLVRIPASKTPAGTVPLVIFWEGDRSTETLAQFKTKVPAYKLLLIPVNLAPLWPEVTNPTARVFVVTRSDEKRKNIAETIKDLDGSEAFRLAARPTLSPESFFTTPVWFTTTGEAKPIMRHRNFPQSPSPE